MNIKSQATIYYTYDLDGTSYKNVATSNTLSTPLKVVNIYAKKIASSTYFKPNDVITYTIVVNNESSFKATNVKIKDLLDGQTYLPSSFNYYFLKNNSTTVTLKETDNNLNFKISELEPYSVCVITYKAKVNETNNINQEIYSESVISSNETESFKTNKLTLQQKYAKVICEKSILNDVAYLNTNLTYKISVKNVGNYEAANLEIVDQLPETFELSETSPITINDKEINNYSFNKDFSQLTIPLDFLNASEEVTILINGSIVK